ncbi:MAG: TetR/AcrR family transcriptional regulator [Roseiflexaceae bacterium]
MEVGQANLRRDARANRERLLQVAKRLFAEQGISTTAMAEIARTAGVGQGTLYRHFADKNAICHALIQADLEQFQARIDTMLADPQGEPLWQLEQLIIAKVDLTESHLPLFAAMDWIPGNKPKPFHGPFHEWLHQRIMAILQRAVAHGQIATQLDLAFMTETCLAAMTPALYRYQREDLGFSQARIVQGLSALFVEALRRHP